MKKNAQFKSLWPKIYDLLKSPPQGIQLGDFSSKLPSREKIILDPSGPPDKPQAVAYVTTEDRDQNGKIDKIHLVVPHFDKYLQGITMEDLQGKDLNKLSAILKGFIEVIAHEVGHASDFKADQKESFPGGESLAEQKAREAAGKISVQATKKLNQNFRRKSMNKEIISRLIKLAGDLDRKGAFQLSDYVTKVAQDMTDGIVEPYYPGEEFNTKKKNLEKIVDHMINKYKIEENWGVQFKKRFSGYKLSAGNTTLNDLYNWISIARLWKEMAAAGFSWKERGTNFTPEPSGLFGDWEEAGKKWGGPDWTQNLSEAYYNMVRAANRSGLEEIDVDVLVDQDALGNLYNQDFTSKTSKQKETTKSPMLAKQPYTGPKNWQEYVAEPPVINQGTRKKIYQIWMALTDISPVKLSGYDASFNSFIKWYRSSGQPTVERAYEMLYKIFKEENIPSSQTQVSSADDYALKADSMEDVVKNAGINSVFWSNRSKNPFGR